MITIKSVGAFYENSKLKIIKYEKMLNSLL